MTNQTLDIQNNSRIHGIAYIFWFITAFLSIIVFSAGRTLIIRTYTRFFPSDAWLVQQGQGGLSLVSILISLPLGMLVIAIIIGGFEYQHRYKGTSKGWHMIARTLALEVGFLMLALYL
jgi:hypothetical protein